jgi:tRNA (adenine22-N1)-methyltransferase
MSFRDRIKLSERLMNSCEMVTPGLKIADIGCDHAHTSIWLIKNGVAPCALAMDVRTGPLEKARENIRIYGLEDRIELRLSNGLEALRESEAGSLIIAGMGGMLTVQILTEGLSKAVAAKELILQPQSDIGLVRSFLRKNGFCIVREKMCREYGKFYTSMKAVPEKSERKGSGDVEPFLQEVFDEFGEILLRSKDTVLRELLGELKKKNERNLLRIQNSSSLEAREKMQVLLHEKEMIGTALSFYDTTDADCIY